jgi:peptide deformylase
MNTHIIRQIGDTILHSVPQTVDDLNDPSIEQAKDTMLACLAETGGVGIACNQCVEIEAPYQMTVIGVLDDEIRAQAQLRYPNEDIPSSLWMLNPKIIERSSEIYYPESGEGCLSVLGSLRGKVRRHRHVTVQYLDEIGNFCRQRYHGFVAHAIQHEYEHLEGMVFLEKIFPECNTTQKKSMRVLLEDELQTRQKNNSDCHQVDFIPAPLVFDRDKTGKLIIQMDALKEILPDMLSTTLQGILKYL